MKKTKALLIFVSLAAVMWSGCSDDATDAPTLNPPTNSYAYEGFDIDKEFVSYTGEVSPLTNNIRNVYGYGKRWISEVVTPDTTAIFITEVVGKANVDGYDQWIMVDKSENENPTIQSCNESNGVMLEPYDIYYNGRIVKEYKESFDINPYALKIYCYNKPEEVTIISKGTITLMGVTRRAVKAWAKMAWYFHTPQYDYWVEGIGRLFGMKPNYAGTITHGGPIYNPYVRMLQCWDGDKKIYDYREFSEDLYQPDVIFTTVDQEQQK